MMNSRTIGNILYYYATWGVNVMSNEKSTVSFSKRYGLLFAVLAMLVIFLLPTPTDLTTAGHRMLGILIFAIIVWITEAVSYPVSAAIIATLMCMYTKTCCLHLRPSCIKTVISPFRLRRFLHDCSHPDSKYLGRQHDMPGIL